MRRIRSPLFLENLDRTTFRSNSAHFQLTIFDQLSTYARSLQIGKTASRDHWPRATNLWDALPASRLIAKERKREREKKEEEEIRKNSTAHEKFLKESKTRACACVPQRFGFQYRHCSP